MAEIRLEEAIFGMSNNNHQHVHRHNQLLLDSLAVDQLKTEQMAGGIRASTINNLAIMSGSLSTQPQGYVDLEDGWNSQHGLGMLRFVVTQNSLMEEHLSVLGYLTGGAASIEGIEEHTLFVPVRSWSQVVENKINPLDGMPISSAVINDSSQFLMGDAMSTKKLHALRPVDIADSIVGYTAVEMENDNQPAHSHRKFSGNIGSELAVNGITVSKTHNLNPVFHSRELIKMATNIVGDMGNQFGTQYAMSEASAAPGMGEMSPTENPFLRTMQINTGMHTFRGFNGFSLNDIQSVFSNFTDVMNLNLMDPNQYSQVDNLATSNEYGSASLFEILGSELAYTVIHTLMQTGLMSLSFSATNDIAEIGGIQNENGVQFIPGEAMSVLKHDNHLANRVENFINLITTNFFGKLNAGYQHNRTVVGVEVESYMFGETTVRISLNGNFADTRKYVNATFAINRHSTNIGANQVSIDQAQGFYDNIKNYFQD